MSPSKLSAADQQLIDHAARHGFAITAKKLAGWRRAGLLPGNVPGGGLGQGRGSTSSPPSESFDLVVALARLARLAGRGKRPTALALLLFAEGRPVPEATIRAAFRASVDTVALPGEDDGTGEDLDLDDRLDHLSNHLADSGQTITLVPARVRRIDERIGRALGELPAELQQLDQNTEPPRLTPQDASLTAVTATLGGSVSVQDIGAMLRAMNPGMTAHPIASLVETGLHDRGRLMSDSRGEPLDEVLERFTESSGRARELAGDLHGNLSKAHSAIGHVAYKEAPEEHAPAAGI
ncbi:hypothetical protein AB0D12_39900 [Streptomyces sp. NPDC048479]|uniref:hypothetical protein n=1 Tax=Streptomyces sp. NPDC048479 TaxID=3154725 RepID=UPI00344AD60D